MIVFSYRRKPREWFWTGLALLEILAGVSGAGIYGSGLPGQIGWWSPTALVLIVVATAISAVITGWWPTLDWTPKPGQWRWHCSCGQPGGEGSYLTAYRQARRHLRQYVQLCCFIKIDQL
jgi:hypothetical protein